MAPSLEKEFEEGKKNPDKKKSCSSPASQQLSAREDILGYSGARHGPRSHELLDSVHNATRPAAATAATATAALVRIVRVVPVAAAVDLDLRASRSSGAANGASSLDSLANKAGAVAGDGLAGQIDQALNALGQAQAEAGKQAGEDARCDEGHEDEEEHLPGVLLGPVDEVAEEALELLVRIVHEAVAGGALIVAGFTWERARLSAFWLSSNTISPPLPLSRELLMLRKRAGV